MLNFSFNAGAMRNAWWWVLPPGLCLSLFVTSAFMITRAYEEMINPTIERVLRMAILEVKDLKIYYKTLKGYSKAVDGVSFQIEENEFLGLVGESGCGESTIAKAILRILPVNGEVVGGEVRYKGKDILSMKPRELKKVQWKEISDGSPERHELL